jgi:hypothetical protein
LPRKAITWRKNRSADINPKKKSILRPPKDLFIKNFPAWSKSGYVMGNGGKTRQDRNVWGPVQIWPSGLMEFLF